MSLPMCSCCHQAELSARECLGWGPGSTADPGQDRRATASLPWSHQPWAVTLLGNCARGTPDSWDLCRISRCDLCHLSLQGSFLCTREHCTWSFVGSASTYSSGTKERNNTASGKCYPSSLPGEVNLYHWGKCVIVSQIQSAPFVLLITWAVKEMNSSALF